MALVCQEARLLLALLLLGELGQAAILDEVASVSPAMNGLVDALIDRISLLAEVVIDSSQGEHCALAHELPGGRHQDPGGCRLASDGCSMFGLPVNERDLPVGEMLTCCRQLDRCYRSSCNLTQLDKLRCDSQFSACLKDSCKLRFDSSNQTLVRELNKRDLEMGAEPSADDDDLDVMPASHSNTDEDSDDLDSGEQLEPAARRRREELERRQTDTSGQQLEQRRVRDKYKACRLGGKLLIIGNLAFGCKRFKESQSAGCCPARV